MNNPTWTFEITELPNGGLTIATRKGVATYDRAIVIAAASKADLSRTIVECMDAERGEVERGEVVKDARRETIVIIDKKEP